MASRYVYVCSVYLHPPNPSGGSLRRISRIRFRKYFPLNFVFGIENLGLGFSFAGFGCDINFLASLI
jgi:hypothetical protein